MSTQPRLNIDSYTPEGSASQLSVLRTAEILQVSPQVARKGLAGKTIPNREMSTISSLAAREIIRGIDIDGVPVPILRPGIALSTEGTESKARPFTGWLIDQSPEHTTLALDRWWRAPGYDLIVGAGGYIVAVGSVICAVLGDIDEKSIKVNAHDRYNYNATLAGVLRSNGEIETFGSGVWADLASKVIGKRVLGGGGGHFTRI